MSDYSFLTSCYIKSKADEFVIAMDRMLNQTLPPEQIVIVCDGAVSEEVDTLINEYVQNNTNLFTIVRLEQNQGHGIAMHEGELYCRNEIICCMDMDDICVLDRCEKLIKYLDENPDIDLVGSNISEFIEDVDNIVGVREVPETHEDICKFMKMRCPFNHMSVAMRKSALEKAGGYKDCLLYEDYYLWVRMYLAGCKFHNIQENLIKARVGMEMYARRGGYKYYKSGRKLFKFMHKNKVINWFEYKKIIFIKFVVQVLMPNWLRKWFYLKFTRKTNK